MNPAPDKTFGLLTIGMVSESCQITLYFWAEMGLILSNKKVTK
jgi:hypothetical protein